MDLSQKKTPIINAVTRPIEEYQQKLWNRYKDECLYAEDPETDCRKPMRYVVYDTTIEKLADILSYSNRGVLVKRDEIAGWIGSMEKYGGTGRGASAKHAFWLQAYDGGSYIVDRIQRGQTIVEHAEHQPARRYPAATLERTARTDVGRSFATLSAGDDGSVKVRS